MQSTYSLSQSATSVNNDSAFSSDLFSSDEHILFQPISNLSMKVQKDLAATSNGTKGNYVILKLENESIEYIQRINLNVLKAIVIETREAVKSPESECSFVMTSVINMKEVRSLFPLTDLESFILRVKEVT